MSQVVKAAPSVPQIKSGVARRVADAPKIFVKRERFVGKIEDVPNPAIAAPMLKSQTFAARSKMLIPSKIVSRFKKSILISFKNRRNNGATPRPMTKNRKYKNIGGNKFIVAESSIRPV